MLTTTDDTREVERCYALGCNGYIQKPVDYERFADAIRNLGLFVPLAADSDGRHLLSADACARSCPSLHPSWSSMTTKVC